MRKLLVVFLFNLAVKLLENASINEHAIDLIESKQPSCRPIYSPGSVELETLKDCIETHLKTDFIWSSKSFAGASFLFDKKLKASFWLCVNYRGLNNLTIKDLKLLPLIGEALD